MFFISIFIQFIKSDCQDYDTPSATRSFINSLRSLKSKRTMLLFGIDSYPDFPAIENFNELKDKVLPFLMGEFYTNFLIFILGLVAFFFFLSCTILITTCCTPRERSKPGFFTTIIWWIIFSILFIVSIIYFILSIAYAPDFINNFPEIPKIVQNGFAGIINDTNLFISNYKNKVLEVLSDNNINTVMYPSFALLMSNYSITTVRSFTNNLNSLSNSIDSFQNVYNGECNGTEGHPNCAYLKSFISSFREPLINLTRQIDDFIRGSNTVHIYDQNRFTIPVLYDFQSLKWTEAQIAITKYRYNEVEKSKQSFDTNRNYVNIPLKYINIVILILVVAFYVCQTVTFFTQLPFSRCCVISVYPISMIASVGIAIFGIFATSVSCAIGDVCADSSRFVSQYFFLRDEFISNYSLPMYNPQLFSSPDNNLFTTIGGEYLINFDDIRHIENTSKDINNDILQTKRFTGTVPEVLKDSHTFNYSDLYIELNKLYNDLALKYATNTSDRLMGLIRNVINVISDVNYRYSIQFQAIKTIQSYDPNHRVNYKSAYFERSNNSFIPALQNFANLQSEVTTSSFCCPVRDVKKVFCKETSATFSCFSIFAHFYVLSLIGFGIVLCFRRQGMLSSTYGIEDDNDRRKKDTTGSDYEPRTADFIRPNAGSSYRETKAYMSDASDSESKSSFTTLDMYAQSKIL